MTKACARAVVLSVGMCMGACAAHQEHVASPPATSGASATTTPSPTHACGRQRPTTCEGPAPSLARDVRPILERRCFSCHAGDGIAADEHNWSQFSTLHAQREQVLDQISACAMPPRGAPTTLADDEAATLAKWIVCGGRDD